MTSRLKQFFFFAAFCFCSAAFGQDNGVALTTKAFHRSIETSRSFNPILFQSHLNLHNEQAVVLNGYAGYASNTIDVKLLKAAYDNAFITKPELDRVNNRSENNFIETDLSAQVGIAWSRDSSRFTNGLYLQVRNTNHTNLSRGLASLIYYGNAPFENSDVDIEGDLHSLSYRRIQYAATYHVSTPWRLTGGIGVAQGTHVYNGRIDGSLFTATGGDYLDLDYNFDFRSFKAERFTDFNTMGLTLTAGAMYHQPDSRSFLTFGLQEVGWLFVPSAARRYKADSLVTFDGFEIGNVFGLDDSSFVNLNGDSIKRSLGVRETNEAFVAQIPARLFVHYSIEFSGGWNAALEAEYAPTVYPTPYVALHAGRWFGSFYADACFNTATFNTLNFGLLLAANVYMNKSHDRYVQLKLQSGYVNALVVPENTKGLDAAFEISYRF